MNNIDFFIDALHTVFWWAFVISSMDRQTVRSEGENACRAGELRRARTGKQRDGRAH
jgi:hypothetical protein